MLGQSCTNTQNCSQKDLQWRILPSKVGISSLGSFTPLPLEDEVGESVLCDDTSSSFLA